MTEHNDSDLHAALEKALDGLDFYLTDVITKAEALDDGIILNVYTNPPPGGGKRTRREFWITVTEE